jgi:SagB-type dehydrogenase family enzyme
METYRNFLRSDRWDEWTESETDQKKGVSPPPPQKRYPKDATLIDLVAPEELTVGNVPLIDAIKRRRSRRKYTEEPLTLEELSFLLWATQGINRRRERKIVQDGQDLGHDHDVWREMVRAMTLRTVPSGGARHPFETYLLVRRVEGLEIGLYRYLPLEHKLCLLSTDADLTERVHVACYEQYARNSAVVFIWTAIPYRTEWRYTFLSPKMIAQDSGHLCQNLYLACEAIGAGTCAIGAYDQDKMDPIPGVDGSEEFAVYVATVGKVN